MTTDQKQLDYEASIEKFLDTCKSNDLEGLLQYNVSLEDLKDHSLDRQDVFKLIASSTLVVARSLKLGVSINSEGWSFWFGSVMFPVLSGDFKPDDSDSQMEDIAKLFVDISYRRFGIVFHVSNIDKDEIYDLAGRKVTRVVRAAQYYLKTQIYEHLATTLPYPKWVIKDISNGRQYTDTLQTNEVIVIPVDEAATMPFESSVELLRRANFPINVGIDERSVDNLSKVSPINQGISFIE